MAKVTLYGLIAIGLAVAVALGFAFGRQRPLPAVCKFAQGGMLATTLVDPGTLQLTSLERP